MSRSAGILAAALTATAMSACTTSASNTSSASGGSASTAKIAFLMPDHGSTRYESYDRPLFTAKVKELCPGCTVVYANADTDAAKQQQQANSALAQGVKVIVIDPVDSTAAASIVTAAHAQGVKVVAYDRPIPGAKADYYVSFDNEKIGSLIAQSLVDHLKATNAQGGILQINGSPTDAAAGLIKKGVHSALDPSGFKILAEYDTPDWKPSNAQDWASGQITKFGKQIVGIAAANDGTGGGAIAALKAAGVNPVSPVTGNDAELAALQRIVNGDQYNTISKPIKIVAEASADVAWQFAQGKTPESKATLFDTPSQLFTPTVVTIDNLKETVVTTGIVKASDVCTAEYQAACAKHGIN
jgi:simple sugar transport system substrate-binding protein/D-xylose transport system substrate-binding protein